MSVYTSEDDEKDTNNVLLKGIDEDTKLTLDTFDEKQHFTQPPAHYTEASLVKTLEELGIGRPSTYSPTITTLLGRRYIVKEAKNLYVTELGEVVNQIMKESFPSIVDEHFTANMESLLDSIGEGAVNWRRLCGISIRIWKPRWKWRRRSCRKSRSRTRSRMLSATSAEETWW